MAGYVIHIAVAEEYLKKHQENIENREDFIKGVIYPDSVSDKSITHYGEGSSKVRLEKFLKENEINNSFNRGYFLHLLTDYLFYNKYLDIWTKDIYNDYDILNKLLIEKYDLKIPDEISNCVFFKEGVTKILSREIAIKVIEEISNLDIDEVEKEIKENPSNKKWAKFNPKI